MHRIPIVPLPSKRNLFTHFQIPPPNPNISSPFRSHSTGLSTALRRHTLTNGRPSFPTCLASNATPNGSFMRSTKGLGLPKCAYECNRYDVDGVIYDK